MTGPIERVSWRIANRAYSTLLVLFGVVLSSEGVVLVSVGGSAYYLIAGLVTLAAGILIWRGNRWGARLYGFMWLGTVVWALSEVGINMWALVARLAALTVLGIWLVAPWVSRCIRSTYSSRVLSRFTNRKLLALALFILVTLAISFYAIQSADRKPRFVQLGNATGQELLAGDQEWRHFGHDIGGKRFSPASQITPENVAQLSVAWTFRTGYRQSNARSSFESTALEIEGTLFICTPSNDVIAIDADTGKERWRFIAHVDQDQVFLSTCRGVAYYRNPQVSAGNLCNARIITATIDARLLAVDALTGKRCTDFGSNGAVDLLQGMGHVEKGYYYVTSAPQIVRGNIVVGGWVSDNQYIGEPSGVVRAFDAVTGRFVWAFDVGRPDTNMQPNAGESYTRGTPNSWGPISADETLGLVYLPLGNPIPDWYGGLRRPFDEKYSSAVVALDAATGALKWSFQTVHHDLWDYDVAAQPTLFDFRDGSRRIPALIQSTKRGEIFVLDRENGNALTEVAEISTPVSNVPGEHAAPTQPFSVGMPSFAGPPLTEKMMWGLTPLDQAWCRIAFKKSRYEGPLTPPGVGRPTIVYPGYMGGIDWGGVSIDTDRDIMIVNSMRIAVRATLIPRAEADAQGIRPISPEIQGDVGGTAAQAGTPYAINLAPFLSPLRVPCQEPPYGILTAVDMRTRQLKWSHSFGTAHDSGPLGLPSFLPVTMGVPNIGGSVITSSGLVFIAATQDQYLRAYDSQTGKELWKARLPAGGQATPITYISVKSGRQFLVIAAGGHEGLGTKSGDYLLAYALPII